MQRPLIECVPNFSEGRDKSVIRKITDAIESVDGVKLLDVDPGAATNRTVVTFVGEPAPIIEAAVRAARCAKEWIDMRKHHGEHPRFGAMDVCPLVPIANITMEETVKHAHALGKRLGDEVGVTIYCYENAATKPERRNLATVRSGEYEGLADKLKDANWKPDFGPAQFDPKYGATAVSARDFLVAYNVNLNTTSTRRAMAVACDVREQGRAKREGDSLTGEIVYDKSGEPARESGACKCVKGIGWFIKEYGVAQVSMNLTNISVTPVHVAFEECCKSADARGMRVTGSEIVGLIPLNAMLDAGRYFLRKQQRSLGVPDSEIIKIAIKSMGLDDLTPFDPREKIIEYKMAEAAAERLVDLSVKDFVEETASESPAPGGGSVSALVGALGVSLAVMVANLSAHKRGWDDRWEEFSEWAVKGKRYYDRLLQLVDEDTEAFNAVIAANRLPDGNEQEKATKQQAVESANKNAMLAPLRVMEVCHESMGVMKAMAEIGNPASVSDAGVAALCARTAIMGAMMNVKINESGVGDKKWVADTLANGAQIQSQAQATEKQIVEIVEGKL